MTDAISLPTPYAAARIAALLAEHLSWSAFWDKREGVWRVSENDPDSELYAVSRDADTVTRYMSAHSRAGSRTPRQRPRDKLPEPTTHVAPSGRTGPLSVSGLPAGRSYHRRPPRRTTTDSFSPAGA